MSNHTARPFWDIESEVDGAYIYDDAVVFWTEGRDSELTIVRLDGTVEVVSPLDAESPWYDRVDHTENEGDYENASPADKQRLIGAAALVAREHHHPDLEWVVRVSKWESMH